MDSYLEPQDDGLPMRNSGPWVSEKLFFLKRYIDIFEKSMRQKPWRRRIFIDLFSGPGKCFVEETSDIHLGSPLLALTTDYPFTDYYFVDIDTERSKTLQKRCSASNTSAQIHYLVGDSNIKVHEIVEGIQEFDRHFIRGQWPSLNLAFLDPDGLELEWNTIANLAKVEKMDMIIHYSQAGLTRNIELCYSIEEETIIDRFFGDREWRTLYAPWRTKGNRFGLHRELIDYYKTKLQALGYVEVLKDDETGAEPLIRNSKRQAPLYRLIFASKHPLGHDFWKAVTRKDVYGQGRLF